MPSDPTTLSKVLAPEPAAGAEEPELAATADESDESVGAAETRVAREVEDARVAMMMEELVGTRMVMCKYVKSAKCRGTREEMVVVRDQEVRRKFGQRRWSFIHTTRSIPQ